MGVKYLYGIDVTGQSTFSTNVGIGTLSPNANLDIVGGVVILGQNKIDGSSDNLKIMSDFANISGSSTIEFSVDNSEKMRITNAGNVGIGTTSPGAKFQVDGSNSNGLIQAYVTSGGGNALRLNTNFGGGNYIDLNPYVTGVSNGGFEILQNGTQRLVISSSGNVGIGTTSPSEKLHVDGNARVTGAYYDTSNSPGTVNQLLSSTVTGTTWINPSAIVAEAATLVVIACKNTSGAAIAQGTPVYQTGTVGATATIEIAPADALISENKLPAIGLLQTALNNNGFGFVVITGALTNFTTSPIDGVVPTTGDKVFVKSGGGLTLTKPTGEGNGIQNMGLVGKVSTGSAGSITVSSIMRTNDVPNLPEGRIWVGDGNTLVSDTVYIDEPNNRFGIGTTSPSRQLEVSNTGNAIIRIAGDSDNDVGETGDAVLEMTTDAGGHGWSIRSANIGGGTGDFKVNTFISSVESTKLLIDRDGNVGIGTTAPIGKLHVNTFNTSNNALTIQASNWTARTYGIGIDSSSSLSFYDNFSSLARLIITSSGNVGIGTTSPAEKLSIEGSGSQSLSIYSTDTGISGTPKTFIKLYGESAAALQRLQGQISVAPGVNTNSGDMILSTANTAAAITERMRIDGAGNVGIGTTSPSTLLHIEGSSAGYLQTIKNTTAGGDYLQMLAETGDAVFQFESGGTGGEATLNMYRDGTQYVKISADAGVDNYFNNGANVGIGTTSPAYKLHIDDDTAYGGVLIEGDNAPGLSIRDNSGTSISKIYVQSTAGSQGNLRISSDDNNTATTPTIEFIIGGSHKMRVLDNGNVGIGTTSPSAKLDVEGDVSIKNVNLSNQENLDVDTGTEVIAIAPIALYTAAFFDFVVKNGANVRSGTVYACHDGTSVEYTETSTADLGNTSAVVFTVDISAGNMRLLATTTTDNWSIKTLTRTI